MEYPRTSYINGKTIVLGNTSVNDTEEIDIISSNGTDIKINGIVPGAGGGGGVPPVGDVSFIGNLDVNNTGVGGVKGEITFQGQDIYHQALVNPGDPIPAPLSYVNYKQLAEKNENQLFTGQNDFAERVRIQLSDGAPIPTYTDKITFNTSGNIACIDINNDTQITTGSITCDNGPDNECKARIFNLRTSGTNGWNIKQQVAEAAAPANAGNNILQIAATQAQVAGIPVEVFITSSEYDPSNGDNPNIKLIPSTILNGGRIQASQFDLGTASGRYYLKQDIGGPLDQVLQIKAPSATGEIHFQDNLGGDTLKIKNASVDLKNDIPLNFGLFSFRPQQFYKDITGFSFNHSGGVGPTNLLFNTGNPAVQEWTNVNTGVGSQPISLILNPGAYKLTIRQLTPGTQNEINGMRIMSDIVLSRPNDNAPDVELPNQTAYSYERYDGTAPVITMVPGFLTWAVHCIFPGTTNNETANIRITLTQMPFFA